MLGSTLNQNDFLISKKDGLPVVTINMMRVTVKEMKQFKQVLDSLLAGNYNKIIIDFNDCIYADSAIIGLMVNVVKEMRKGGGDIRAVTPPGSIENIFKVTGLQRIFKTFNTLDEAVESFSI